MEGRSGSQDVMTSRLLDGVAIANQIRAEVAPAVQTFRAAAGRPPRRPRSPVGISSRQ